VTDFPDPGHTALYLYGVVPSVDADGEPLVAAARGLDGANVHVVTSRDIGVVTHVCAPVPYEGDVAQVHAWVLAQHEVVTSARAQAGTILPIRFNSIVAATDSPAAQVLIDWLDQSHDQLAARLDELRDRVELGVQVFAERASPGVPASPATAPARGRAYFQAQLGQRQEKERVRANEALIASSVFGELAALSEGIVVNPKRPQREGNDTAGSAHTAAQMLLDVALLALPDQVGPIGEYLAGIASPPELTLRFTGPWPPYAFTGAFDMPLLVPEASDAIHQQGST